MELIGNKDAFPILREWDFFNHAGVSPLPRCAADAIRIYAAQAESVAYLNTGWYRDAEKLRILSASLINAHRDEIAFVKNTSEGIATVANGIAWQRGDRIVTTAVEYPANIYPWMDVAQRFGVELVMVPEESIADGTRRVQLERILEAAGHPRTRLVALSHVEFASGQRHDLASIGAYCRTHGKLFCVDAIQSLGILPVDVQAMNIDYLSADGHKWMLGPEGAGIFYCRRQLLSKTHPLIVGWLNVINPDDYGHYDFTLKPDAGRFECGSYNIPGLLGFKAALELLTSAGIPAIAQRIQQLTHRLILGLAGKGYQILSPRRNDEWSGIVSFVSTKHDHQEIFRKLRHDHKTEIAVREGRLRCSPHFYNTEEQIDRLIAHLPGH
ncbi:MAG TPA: aminotransferase class V-fold PLP-dependent enzyme [Tepidisphaeraceae bacterium]|nr:aminotransferase class V-fold PLP-dependent enzyme [Tepidisphaeraceae bacterium]